jgi:hypothetical protein
MQPVLLTLSHRLTERMTIALGSWIHPIRYNHMYCEERLGAEYMPSQASCDCKPMNSWNKGTTFHEGITLYTKSLQYAKYMP